MCLFLIKLDILVKKNHIELDNICNFTAFHFQKITKRTGKIESIHNHWKRVESNLFLEISKFLLDTGQMWYTRRKPNKVY